MLDIPSVIFLPQLQNIEPDAQFTFNLPTVISSAGNKYYAKLGSVAESDQYIGEAESLKAIHDAAPGLAPRVFASGVVDWRFKQGGQQTLLPLRVQGDGIIVREIRGAPGSKNRD
ncbi:hypothetical protein J3R82DRAFT_423 [Butyriboletus roseoflavus]|nr:hypothetical protein J3R82DRAFT_423 [Butyriboletus roseoflavus]